MTIQEVVTAQTAELARIRSQVDNEAKRGQMSNDVRDHGSRRDDQSGPHDNRNHESKWQVAGAKRKQRSQRKNEKKILGKRKESNLLGAADRFYDIFVGGGNLTTTVESLKQYC